MSSFAGDDWNVPFVNGAIYGLRAFGYVERSHLVIPETSPFQRPEKVPALVGPSFSWYAYHDGENQAKCYVNSADGAATYHERLFTGTKRCSCGFYAYTNGSNTYALRDRVTGIVQSYGRVTYGSEGFRSSKCRIVAAVNPWLPGGLTKEEAPPDWYLAPAQRGTRWPNGKWEFVQYTGLRNPKPQLGVFSFELFLAALMFWQFGWWAAIAPLFCAVLFIIWMCAGLGWKRKVTRHDKDIIQSAEWDAISTEANRNRFEGSRISKDNFDRLMKNYPQVKWFATRAEMLEAFPLTRYADMPSGGRTRTYT